VKGLLLSEFPMELDRPFRRNFPIRNRVISGMSTGILVVEGRSTAGRRYGKVALDQGRELFAALAISHPRRVGARICSSSRARSWYRKWNDVVTELRRKRGGA